MPISALGRSYREPSSGALTVGLAPRAHFQAPTRPRSERRCIHGRRGGSHGLIPRSFRFTLDSPNRQLYSNKYSTMNESRFPRSYTAVLEQFRGRLREPAPGLVQILSGPRQVGKTTLLLELARELGESALYAAADTSGAALSGWWEELGQRAERLAASGTATLLGRGSVPPRLGASAQGPGRPDPPGPHPPSCRGLRLLLPPRGRRRARIHGRSVRAPDALPLARPRTGDTIWTPPP
jgi:hypothetical protein